jgi:FkbM family methyltransferase
MNKSEIFIVTTEGVDNRNISAAWNTGIDEAISIGADWILFLEPDTEVMPDALELVQPALLSYDAVWGAMAVPNTGGELEIPKVCRFSCSDFVGACHMVFQWWAGRSHFVRTTVANDLRFDPAMGEHCFADYFTRIWRQYRCLKTQQAFLSGPGPLPEVSPAGKTYLLDLLEREPQFISFEYAGRQIRLPYTGRNPTLERTQLRGVFFEQPDLEALTGYLQPGAVIVDVGANTGNHSVFFAHVLKAGKVIPIEPNPLSIAFLNHTIEANAITVMDTSKLGVAVGEHRSKLYLHSGRRGHLGTVRLAAEGETEVEVWPLDELISEPVDFLKIDVEFMEVEVLKGARELINRDRPLAMVEVQDENISAFLAFLKDMRYRVERIFADQGYANYLILPEGKN